MLASSTLRFASVLGFALFVSGTARALDEAPRALPPDARLGATSHAALPFACAPRRGSPVGAAAGFALAVGGAAAFSRRRADRLR